MIKIKRSKGKKPGYYSTVIGKNGKILYQSEVYTQKHNCIKAIKALVLVLATMQAQGEDVKDETL